MQGMGHGRRVLYVQLAGLGAVATVLALDAGGVVRGPAVGALAFAVGAATGAVITLVQYRALNGPGFVGDVLRGTLPGFGLAALAIPWAPVAAALGARPLVQLVAAGLAWAAIVGVTVRRGPYLQSRRRVS